MAVSKTARTLQASASNSAGNTLTGTGISLSTALGGTITAKITNGGTGPTVPADCVIQISNDGTNWKEYMRATAKTGNSVITEFSFEIPPAVMNVRSVFTGNTGQAVTCEAFFHELTSI
jgi:hypothetical protein